MGLQLTTQHTRLILFADDFVPFLSDPQKSMPALNEVLIAFETHSGLFVNPSKSILYPINLSDNIQLGLKSAYFFSVGYQILVLWKHQHSSESY